MSFFFLFLIYLGEEVAKRRKETYDSVWTDGWVSTIFGLRSRIDCGGLGYIAVSLIVEFSPPPSPSKMVRARGIIYERGVLCFVESQDSENGVGLAGLYLQMCVYVCLYIHIFLVCVVYEEC